MCMMNCKDTFKRMDNAFSNKMTNEYLKIYPEKKHFTLDSTDHLSS